MVLDIWCWKWPTFFFVCMKMTNLLKKKILRIVLLLFFTFRKIWKTTFTWLNYLTFETENGLTYFFKEMYENEKSVQFFYFFSKFITYYFSIVGVRKKNIKVFLDTPLDSWHWKWPNVFYLNVWKWQICKNVFFPKIVLLVKKLHWFSIVGFRKNIVRFIWLHHLTFDTENGNIYIICIYLLLFQCMKMAHISKNMHFNKFFSI